MPTHSKVNTAVTETGGGRKRSSSVLHRNSCGTAVPDKAMYTTHQSSATVLSSPSTRRL